MSKTLTKRLRNPYVSLNVDVVVAIHHVLTRANVGLVPVPKTATRPWTKHAVTLETASLRKVALRVIVPPPPRCQYDVAVMHLDGEGRLVFTTAPMDRMDVHDGRVAELLVRRANGAGVTTVLSDLTDPSPNIKAMNEALVLPTRISDIDVIPEIFRDIVSDFRIRTCFNHAGKVDLSDGKRVVGNNVESLGLRAEDYIHAMYAWHMLHMFGSHQRGITYRGDVLPIYREIERAVGHVGREQKDPWQNDRLERENLPILPPDPRAYEVLTKIERPRVERAAGNRDTSTFDFIRVSMGLRSTDSLPRRREHIRKYARDLARIALIRVAQERNFQRKNVPIQFLRLAEMTLTRDNSLEFLFELRET